ncbi:MarC family protein [Marilutibacter aestuarii]|uniref:UPF0056 membrane protein n=1 Tax=Marilutibacter aestuarii TaxID=1706195 RepID=A0A508A5B0_9GAMM|nr:MarC family protein [Lysobacter aestuarii]TQD43963.1 MarC family protein [Lysobacter aestuarii]
MSPMLFLDAVSSIAAVVPALPTAPSAAGGYELGYDNIFLVLFIMLGPIKAMGDYFLATRELPGPQVRTLALKVFALSTLTILLAGVVGSALLQKWQITAPVMQLVAGIVFFMVAIRMVLAQYGTAAPPPPAADAPPGAATMHLVFPVTITPYGIAAVITLMALSHGADRSLRILGLTVLVMVLNLLALLTMRFIMKWIGMIPLKILSAVLGILQVALAAQVIVGALWKILAAT